MSHALSSCISYRNYSIWQPAMRWQCGWLWLPKMAMGWVLLQDGGLGLWPGREKGNEGLGYDSAFNIRWMLTLCTVQRSFHLAS